MLLRVGQHVDKLFQDMEQVFSFKPELEPKEDILMKTHSNNIRELVTMMRFESPVGKLKNLMMNNNMKILV